MKYRDDDDSIRLDAIVNNKRELRYDGFPNVPQSDRILQRVLTDLVENSLDMLNEFLAQPLPLLLIPLGGLGKFGLRKAAKDDFGAHDRNRASASALT